MRIGAAAATFLAGLALMGGGRGVAAGKGAFIPRKEPKAVPSVGRLSLADHECNHFGSLSCPSSGSSGEISSADCRLNSGSYLDLIQFQGSAGQAVTIEMESSAFDTYLYLLDPTPVVVTSDDDFGGTTNSNIAFTLTTSGTWTVGATSLLANQFGAYTVTLSCTSGEPTPATPTRIIPVVGSTPGAGGSFFRTSVQLHNGDSASAAGRIVFHPSSQSASDSDPSLPYSLTPGQTLSFADLLPAVGRSGLGSADLFVTTGSVPIASVRVFNDGGAAGTTGFTEELVRPDEALRVGEKGVLLLPADLSAYRFNIGVRTFDSGASVTLIARDASGSVVTTLARSFPADYHEQQAAGPFFGGASLPANGSLTILVGSGSAVFYGATVDNRTGDPSLQITRPAR